MAERAQRGHTWRTSQLTEIPMSSDAIGTLENIRTVYSGAEGDLWELLMGQQIHIGGFKSSMELAERADIGHGQRGVDLCCCNGAGMRFLVRFRDVAGMTGVDATAKIVKRARARIDVEGLAEKITVVQGDARATGLPAGAFDFVWGEDAWCYVFDKAQLIMEAARLVKVNGVIAFTDWVAGTVPMTSEESARFLKFMSFPNLQTIEGYRALLQQAGCTIKSAEDTGRFASYADLYLEMVDKQLTFDALRILDYKVEVLQAIGTEMQFLRDLAHAGKLTQGRFIARKNSSKG